ncbi:NAD(P)H-dependent glycerol-3-phosphate dehydrogenase [Kineococcus sp. R8]|nr:NAD(P)H-dependent glycerol-3-phosphate dehydrogenase [Kineococcus siccus]
MTARRTSGAYLPGVTLPSSLTATADVGVAADGADLVVLAVPLQLLAAHLQRWRDRLPAHAPFVLLTKGVETGTGRFGHEVLTDGLGVGPGRVVLLSGPNLALEVAQGQPAATVVACADASVAQRVADACRSSTFRPYLSTDVVGVDVAGAMKNVVTLALGMAEGAGFGANARAALLTRGLAEATRLGVALGADALTFLGLAGLGDLVATSLSTLSRNHRVGLALGRGATLEQALASLAGGTAEGVASTAPVLARARSVGVELPLAAEVLDVLAGRRTPQEASERLLSRPPAHDGP